MSRINQHESELGGLLIFFGLMYLSWWLSLGAAVLLYAAIAMAKNENS